MREIEIKARIANKEKLLTKLKEINVVLSEPIAQHDFVYGNKDSDEPHNEQNWLRIRTEYDSKHTFTLKRSVVGQLDNIEHETGIDDPAELHEILLRLGFSVHSEIKKTRQKGAYSDIELCIDTVEELGDFIEAEVMVDAESDRKAIIERLWQLFDRLGVKKSDEITDGYDVMMRSKIVNIK
jgi:adenylate cyclase, class 2